MTDSFRDIPFQSKKKLGDLNSLTSTVQSHTTQLVGTGTEIKALSNKTNRVSVLEYEHLIPNKASIPDPNNWDWIVAFEAAYAEASTKKAPFYIPPGRTYFLSRTFEIIHDDFTIISEGSFYNGAVLSNKNGNYPTIRFKASGVNTVIRRNMMVGVRVYGQIHAYNCVDLWFDNVFAHYGHDHTLVIEGGWSFKFQGCQFQYAKNGYNVYLTTDPLTTFREVNALSFTSCRVEAGTGGIGGEPNTLVKSLTWSGGIIEGHKGAFAWGINIPLGNSITFDTVYFEGNEKGNGVFGTPTTDVKNLNMKGVQNHGYGDGLLAQRPPFGIHCVNVQGGEITGDSRGFKGSGVIIDTYCSNVKSNGSEYLNAAEENLPVTRLGKSTKSGISGMNIARNGNFTVWGNGMPNSFLKNAGTETIAQETTILNGTLNSLKLTNSTASAGGLLQRYTNFVNRIKGRKIFVAATAKTSVVGRARIRTSDGVNTQYSSVHPGNDKWVTLAVEHTISDTATSFNIVLETVTGSPVDVYWSNIRVVVDGDFSDNLGTSTPSEFYMDYAGTANTTGTPATATITHNLDNNAYVVAITPQALVKYKVTKNTTNFIIETESPCSVDWVIVKI